MGKVLELLGILEIKFNELFFIVYEFIFKIILKITPQAWKDKLHSVEEKIANKKLELKNKKEKFINDTKAKALQTIQWTKDKKADGSLVQSLKDEFTKFSNKVATYSKSHNYKEDFA